MGREEKAADSKPDAAHLRAVAEVLGRSGVSVVEVGGSSMEPSLAPGWRVRIGPLRGIVETGQIVLVQTVEQPVIHRVTHVVRWRGEQWILHAGDRGGLPGMAPVGSVIGVAEAVVSPSQVMLATLDRVEPDTRHRFERTSRRCRVWATLWRVGRLLGLPAGVLSGRSARWLQRAVFAGMRRPKTDPPQRT